MIRLDRVSVTYTGDAAPTIVDADLAIDEGELCLVVGRTGAGKSTLLGLVTGLVPHFTGGTVAGRVSVAGRDTRTHRPRDFADVVGTVGQDPLAGFVTDTVEEELAYGMEQLAIPADVMRKRVEETLDLLGLAELRHRSLRTLSGGQQQRVAIGAVLTAHPSVLVLDEPTSALDPGGAEDVLAAITRLVHDLGVTVLLAEHRLERVVQYADRIVQVGADGAVTDGPPASMLLTTDVAPPVVELGRLAGWQPLPLSVRDARRHAGPLRDRLAGVTPTPQGNGTSDPLLTARDLVVRHGDVVAVAGVHLELRAGQIAALMGRNGAGKSSLLWALQGSGRRHAGDVRVRAVDPARLPPARARELVTLVPQTPADLLYLETVDDECRQADRETGRPAGSTRALLDGLSPGVPGGSHPDDLSEGQRLAVVLAIQLVARPSIVLLDEPTRGLDYPAKRRLADVLRELAADGAGVLVATHDVEFAAAVASRVVVLAGGEVVADGAAAEVVVASPLFAPQVAKVLRDGPWLTVDDVLRELPDLAPDGRSAGGPR